jgi:hypothetical protein
MLSIINNDVKRQDSPLGRQFKILFWSPRVPSSSTKCLFYLTYIKALKWSAEKLAYLFGRGRCYDHNFRRFSTIFGDFRQFSAIFDNFRRGNWRFSQKPILWSQFSAIFDDFRRRNWRFSQKPIWWSQFLQKIAVVWAKNANFSLNFSAKIF